MKIGKSKSTSGKRSGGPLSARGKHHFFESKDTHGNVVFNFIGRPIEDLANFGKGYHVAGRHLAAQLGASGGYCDYEGYPILFLYCHALELYLKSVVYHEALFLGLTSEPKADISEKLFNSHKLSALLPSLRSIFKALEWNFEGTDLTSFEDFAQLIEAVEAVSCDSYAFRYPFTQFGDAYLPQQLIVNVVSFAHHMDGILDFFGDLASGIHEELRANAGARYELEQLFRTEWD